MIDRQFDKQNIKDITAASMHFKLKCIITLILVAFVLNTKAQHNPAWPKFHQGGEVRSVYQQTIRFNEQYSSSFDGGSYIGIGNNKWQRWGLRANIKKDINPFYAIELGFMYNDVTSDQKTSNEYRPHQSLHVNYPRLQHSMIKHRLQIEERLFYTSNTPRIFRTRLRYLISHQGSFKNHALGPKSFYYLSSLEWNFNIYNEIKGKTLLRGRYGFGYGYQFNSRYSIDATYFLEHNAKATSNRHSITHILLFTLRHRIRLYN